MYDQKTNKEKLHLMTDHVDEILLLTFMLNGFLQSLTLFAFGAFPVADVRNGSENLHYIALVIDFRRDRHRTPR